jgi:hypothetical protein
LFGAVTIAMGAAWWALRNERIDGLRPAGFFTPYIAVFGFATLAYFLTSHLAGERSAELGRQHFWLTLAGWLLMWLPLVVPLGMVAALLGIALFWGAQLLYIVFWSAQLISVGFRCCEALRKH